MTRGRLDRAGIAAIESRLDPIYESQNLAEDAWFNIGEDGVTFVDVVDPLTVAESLSENYLRALNEALAFTTPGANKTKKDQDRVEVESRMYQLGRMMLDTLLGGDGLSDPLMLESSLAGGVAGLKKYVTDYENKVSSLMARRSIAARELRTFLESEIMDSSRRWYLSTSVARKSIGHFWTATSFTCLQRLSETPEGRNFLRDLVANADEGLLAFLYPPTPGSRGEQLYGEIFPITRKLATASLIAFAETAPAMILYGKDDILMVERVRVTLENMFLRTTVVAVERAPRGAVTRLFVKTNHTVSLHIEIDYKRTKADYEEWVENGKPHWPEGTNQAKWSEIFGRLFIGIELVNLVTTFNNSVKKYGQQGGTDEERQKRRAIASMEAIGACLDLAVAAEDPLHAAGKYVDSVLHTVKNRGQNAAELAVHGAAEAEHEVAGIFSKLTKPAMFKALGAISAVIDTVCYYREGNEALEKHETGLAVGKYTVAAGSGLIAVASVFNAAGYLATAGSAAVGLTAAASVLLLAGVIIVVIGFIIVACFTTTPWQRFADHSSLGRHPAKAGHDSWSGGDFSAWTPDRKGLDRQMQVLTSMLCGFTVAGDHWDAQTIFVTFGAVPPGAKMSVEYTISYANGLTHTPHYEIDLDTGHVEPGDAPVKTVKRSQDGDHRVESLHLRATRPAAAKMTRITNAKAEIVMRYGGHATSPTAEAASGTIPVSGKMTYRLAEDGVFYTNEYQSLDVGAESEAEGSQAGEHRAGQEEGRPKGGGELQEAESAGTSE